MTKARIVLFAACAGFMAATSSCGAAGVTAYSLVMNRCIAAQSAIVERAPDPELSDEENERRDRNQIGAIRTICDSILDEIEETTRNGGLR